MNTKTSEDKISLKDFKPNLSPKMIFSLGSFGGTYWREIKHKGVLLKNQHKKYNWKIADDKMILKWNCYDKSINKYKVKVGSTLSFWRKNGLKIKIPMDGFSGIVTINKAEDQMMT